MLQLILSIYHYFAKRRGLLWGLLLMLVVMLVFAASRVNFREDISAFLPKGGNIDRINYAYQFVGSANKLIVSVSIADTGRGVLHTHTRHDRLDEELIIDAITLFVEQLQRTDSQVYISKKLTTRLTGSKYLQYRNS